MDTMEVRVQGYGLLRAGLADPEGIVDLLLAQGTDVGQVFEVLAQRSSLFDARACLYFVNGSQVESDYVLADGDELHLYHLFGGG